MYVGSTTNFVKRKQQHKFACNNENDTRYHLKVYKIIRENGGWESWKMIVVHEFPCLNKTGSLQEEDRCMTELKANMQMVKAYSSKEEKIEQKQKYRNKNKEIISEKRKDCYQKNKELVYYNDHNQAKIKKAYDKKVPTQVIINDTTGSKIHKIRFTDKTTNLKPHEYRLLLDLEK